MTHPVPDLSVVVPVLDEEESLEELYRQVRAALGADGDWELLLVDDGSTDRTPVISKALARADPRVRTIRLARRYGQSTAMQAGFDHARADVIVTLDGDLQNDPADIPALLAELDKGFDLVVGYRVRRQDRMLTRRFPSWVANRIIRWMTRVPVRDNGCSLKAYRRTLFDALRLYSDAHRFIPALAVGVAGARVTEIPVSHRPRVAGVSKYGLGRIFRVVLDLAVIKMLRSFRGHPLVMFALVALWSSVLGGLAAVASIFAWTRLSESAASSFVLPGVALLWFALAGFLLLLGLLGETVLPSGPRYGPNRARVIGVGRS